MLKYDSEQGKKNLEIKTRIQNNRLFKVTSSQKFIKRSEYWKSMQNCLKDNPPALAISQPCSLGARLDFLITIILKMKNF